MAAALRFSALDRVPPGIYWDEVVDGQKGLEAVREQKFEVFYHVGSGREGLWINMLGLAESAFGANPFGLRICAALVGTLTVVFVYFLARELFTNRVAIFAAWLLASSFWHVWVSRMAYRAVLVPLLLTASLYLLIRAWREGDGALDPAWQWPAVILSGALYGLGFHSYIAFRFTPILLAFFLLSEYRRRKAFGRLDTRWRAMVSLWLGTAFIVALPIGLYFLEHPQDFWLRAGQVSVFSVQYPLRAFGNALVATLGLFNIRGDLGSVNNIGGSPQLLFPVGVLFLIGIVLASRRAFQKDNQAAGYRLLCAWFAILLIPHLLTLDVPNAVRAIGVIPPVFLFAGMGADVLYERLKQKKVYALAFFLGLVLVSAVEGYRYFVVWGRDPWVARTFGHQYVNVGQYLNSLPKGTTRYVIAGDWGTETIRFLTQGSPSVKYLTWEQFKTTDFPCDSVVVPLYNQPMVFADLANRELKMQVVNEKDFAIAAVQCGH